MSTKNQVSKIIDEIADSLTKALKISHCSIYWHVYHSKDPKLEELGLKIRDCVAVTIYKIKKGRNKTYDIVIYYDKQKGRKDIIGSIIHELLHVRLRQFDRIVKSTKAAKSRYHVIEENLIKDLEKIYLDLI